MVPFLHLESQQWWAEPLSCFESLLALLFHLSDEQFCLPLPLLKAHVTLGVLGNPGNP